LIWTYRVINNPVAKKKWLSFCLALIVLGFAYTGYKIYIGESLGKSLIVAAIFTLFVILYTITTLGKPRHYYIEGTYVYYKPFKTDLTKIDGFEVDEKNLIIKLKSKSLFAVKTLYFEDPEDIKEARRVIERIRSRW